MKPVFAPKLGKRGAGCGVCQVISVILVLFFLAVGAVLLVLKANDSLSIHSCRIYFPRKLSALGSIVESVTGHIQRYGWAAAWEDISAVWRSEVLRVAPYPPLRASVEGKHLLMVGGAKSPDALRRAKQLGIDITLVDDAKMVRCFESRSMG